jgi:hypothetical protein
LPGKTGASVWSTTELAIMTRFLFFIDFLVKGTGFIAKAFAILTEGVFGAKNFGLV